MRRRGRPIALFTLIVLATFAASAQQGPSTQVELQRSLDAAEQLLKSQNLDAAREAFQAAIDAAHRLGLPAEEARADCGLGDTLNIRTEYARARALLEDCLAIAGRMQNDVGIARASMALSQSAEFTGRREDAAAFADRAVEASDRTADPRRRALARLQLERVKKFPPEEEHALIDRIIADARTAGDPGLEAGALHAYGDYLFNVARYEESLESLTRARELYHEASEFGDEGTVLNSIGRLYRAHGNLVDALKCQEQALALHEKYGTPFELMQSHNAVAVVQEFIGNLTAAHVHWDRALAIARESGSSRIQDFLSANIASLMLREGKFADAARALEDVIARGLDSHPSIRYANLAILYVNLNRAADAVKAADQALALCGDEAFSCLDALENRAQAYAALNDLASARADLRKAVDTIESMRSTLMPADRLKQNFQDAQRGIYEASIAIAFRQHDFRESLDTAELATSRAFLDLLEARRTPAGASGDDAAIVFRGAPATDARDLVSKATAAPANADDLVAIAQRLHSTLVEYWPGDNALFIWVVKGDGKIAGRQVAISSARLLELTHGAAPWRPLYDALIAPVRDLLPSAPGSLLTIVPHGVLMTVSFAALQARDGRYLLENYAMHYAPAGAVLRFTSQRRQPNARGGSILLVADPAAIRRSPLDPALPPLPGARREVAEIAALVPRGRVTLLEGGDASESRVRTAAARTGIVHFATHAIVEDDDPTASYLALSHAFLTARDIYDLRLKADLVVLSACRSGGGRVTGDGVAAFARAFVYAGAPSLVVSLWDVADQPAGRLLPAFYRAWLAGASKARSLRRAQLQLLADLRSGSVKVETRAGPVVLPEDPKFWAGFVLIGEPD